MHQLHFHGDAAQACPALVAAAQVVLGRPSTALTQELQAYFWRYPFSVEDIPGGFAGFAVFETGEITIAPGQLQVGSAEALNTYLHEIAHVICSGGHSVEFATLCAGMQKHFNCHDPASVTYDTHEAPAGAKQSYEYHQLRQNSVKPIADPHTYLTKTRYQNWFERQLLPNLLALIVASAAFAVLLGWPWIKLFFQNDLATYTTGVAVVAVALVYALVS